MSRAGFRARSAGFSKTVDTEQREQSSNRNIRHQEQLHHTTTGPLESVSHARHRRSPQSTGEAVQKFQAESKEDANAENVDPDVKLGGSRQDSARTQQYLARRRLSEQRFDLLVTESHTVKTKNDVGPRVSLELSDLSRLLTARNAANSNSNSGLLTSRSSFSTHRTASQSTAGLSRASSASRGRSAISQSQELALQHMYRAQSARSRSSNGRDARTSRSTIDRLAQHKSVTITSRKQFASFDDQRHCTFVPQTKSRRELESKRGDEDDARGRSGLSFMDRQEMKEREKRFKLSEAQLMDAYSKIHPRDKKHCPKCQAIQSYKEHADRIKKCPRCQVEYVRRESWHAFAKGFHQRQEQWAKRVAEEKAAIEAESKKTYQERWVYDSKSGTMRSEQHERQSKRWCDVKDDFFQRLQQEVDRRNSDVQPKRRASSVAPGKARKSRPNDTIRSASKEVIE